ncbi:gephyrin-like molybdotransferase Glp [Marinospirillum alkaliphilum]|uniref:Molybdopterin molybdenumtransferase n=1 Tax=Marinospirillum alkaliphilum DSM 21637 TaxID=1122209 RepID=A0A1K1ZPB0_9GAMM|nr:gephyrin-like molybdotransferase Glp [Marinospirillum alkaliphilum]SFX75571.1 molybdopterin molybdotransferase [Marinospirillum alkaliphilum DSM 21637]
MSLSCFDFTDKKNQLTLEEARQALLQPTSAQTPAVRLPLQQAAGCYLAAPIIAPINVPQNTNSAMDGFALKGTELARQQQWQLIGESLAGQRFSGKVEAGECVYITTGAPLPDGTDTVVMVEQCQRHEKQINISDAASIKPGSNVRQAGEDIRSGQTLLPAGQALGSAQLGLLASLGFSEVSVHQPLRVAVFSTGNEVTAPGLPLPGDGIYDTNRFTLQAMLQALGCQVTDLGILPDDLGSIRAALAEARHRHQLVLTSGGVSMGDADFVRSALNELGETRFWKLALRPGRPFAFGHLGQNDAGQTCLFAGLPGNPVAVVVTFMLLVQPLIQQLQGCQQRLPAPWRASSIEHLKSRTGRSDFHRGVFSISSNGQLQVKTTGPQGSGMLTSVHQGNCLIRIADDQAEIPAGAPVDIYPFHEWLPGYRGTAE